ncbi:hypothetical protein NDN13_01415 [Acinetobacter sp. C32I]|uniref:Gp138 family membrane-puncturing spike protein n=1 Tax=Acinetobacter sp. C32I TaxID=2950074 RepID=UPI00203714E2|nr:Gp138 family membrane-puncturing spike protein [Acinetobacter sp. C32I]USA53879.1 hypothetical protein NDN13_01415 [Acinetobacter sp. C32I]
MQQQHENFGQQNSSTTLDSAIAQRFFISQMLNDIQTVSLVKVVGVNAGGTAPVGFVDVQPLVNQMTGDRKAVEHGVIYKIPYFRIQGGASAIIIDPKVGDIGMCGFCSRDISSVVATKKVANPGSYRKFDWSDGLYFGGFLNGAPSQYIEFTDDGINIVSSKVSFSGDVEIEKTLTVKGVMKSLIDVFAKTVSLLTHITTGVQSGTSNSGPPQQ